MKPAMSKDEALERAAQIWGPNIIGVRPSEVQGQWIVEVAVRTTHTLDIHGHTTCHAQCHNLAKEYDAVASLRKLGANNG
jgi:hypothetical protein